jgi:hypothetical protein
MQHDLTQLSEHDQLLLLAAGELPEPLATQLRRRIQADATLARQFDEACSLLSLSTQALKQVDETEPHHPSERAADRMVRRSINEWLLQRSQIGAAAGVSARPRISRLPVWLYPVGVAAVVMLGLGIWYLALPPGNPEPQGSNDSLGIALIDPVESDAAVAAAEPTELDLMFSGESFPLDVGELASSESELNNIQSLREMVQQ